jgi:hypothetical protein
MPNCLLVRSFQDYDLVLDAFAVKLQFEFEANIQRLLSIRIVKSAKLYEGSSGTIVFD